MRRKLSGRIKKILDFYFILCLWVFACINVCVLCASLVPVEARRGRCIFWNLGYRRLCTIMWVLEAKPKSSARAASVLDFGAICPAPSQRCCTEDMRRTFRGGLLPKVPWEVKVRHWAEVEKPGPCGRTSVSAPLVKALYSFCLWGHLAQSSLNPEDIGTGPPEDPREASGLVFIAYALNMLLVKGCWVPRPCPGRTIHTQNLWLFLELWVSKNFQKETLATCFELQHSKAIFFLASGVFSLLCFGTHWEREPLEHWKQRRPLVFPSPSRVTWIYSG